jgi:hypothetical protein
MSHEKAQEDWPQKGTKVTKNISIAKPLDKLVVIADYFVHFVPFCG